MRVIPFWLKKLAEKENCRLEYRETSHNLRCGEDKVLVLALRKCTATITYYAFVEARRTRPSIWLYDPSNNVLLAKMSWREFLDYLVREDKGIIYPIRRCRVEVKIVAGTRGKMICVPVSSELYERWKKIVQREGDPVRAAEKLLSRSFYA